MRAIFRVENARGDSGNVFIVFPDERANPGNVQIYDPKDGHNEASKEWVQRNSRPAHPGEYERLKAQYEHRHGLTLNRAHRAAPGRRRARDSDYPASAGPWLNVRFENAPAAARFARGVKKVFGYRAKVDSDDPLVVVTNVERWQINELLRKLNVRSRNAPLHVEKR